MYIDRNGNEKKKQLIKDSVNRLWDYILGYCFEMRNYLYICIELNIL